ncbi:REC domain-containing diguanylate cyclase [Nostoc sp. CENA543]|uniref:GGDEF domain-containing response regulator n=1 Tax=Nostoc sp. CENA543 TaxID=1869241 RepID=UPI000CA0D9F5|nr:diguanylate cyclase [Nostoc sp. CENA543]AUT03254.1 REC domain-containing diguanylate cyclase [Nostoc sp. CENA543]
MQNRKILVVEDEKILALNIKNSLQKLGYDVLEITDSAEKAIKNVAEHYPNLVLFDICLTKEINGIQVIDIIQHKFHIPVLYITEYSEYIKLPKNQLSHPFSYILKPIRESDLHLAVEIALEQYQNYRSLQIEKQKIEAIINSMACGVVVTCNHGCIQMMNPMAEQLTGWQQNEAIGKAFTDVLSLVDKDMDEVIGNLAKQAVQVGEVVNLPENCILISKEGKEIPIGDNIAPIRDHNGRVTGAVLVFQDITQRKLTELQILRNAFCDGLTGIPNRTLFLDRLKQAVERSKRRSDYRFAVLFLDLDGFKGINDRFGHSMGDDFLVAIARRLESCVRSCDTVSRFGGDEFAVLLEEIKDINDVINVAKRIQDTLGLPISLNGNQIYTTASIGITLSHGHTDEPERILRAADSAMYRAKQQGKARYYVFNEAANY